MCFSCFCHSIYHKSIMPPPQCDFFNDIYFFLWTAILSIYLSFTNRTSEKNKVYTGNLTHFRQTLQLINPLTPMSDQGSISPNNIYTISIR